MVEIDLTGSDQREGEAKAEPVGTESVGIVHAETVADGSASAYASAETDDVSRAIRKKYAGLVGEIGGDAAE